jgi:pimeloyl-ACP methyl ester carboxylesterase
VLQWDEPCPAGSDAALAGFQCASASVPLDYRRPTGTKISLALVRHLATGPGTRLGTLFINPGGPGGTGTVQIPDWFHFMPLTLSQRFDVVSWDPRGIGQSTAVQCFPNREAELAFLGQLQFFPVGFDQQLAYIQKWAEFGQRCAQRNGGLLEHVTTAETARDLDLLRQAVGEAKLTYVGLSYGTFLGATYANLFPDKVRALVLDGNVAPSAWTNNGNQHPSLSISLRIGTDVGAAKVLDALLSLCGQTSTTDCAFSAGSAAATHAKFDALLARLRRGPITLGTGPTAVSLTYSELLDELSDALDIVQPYQNQQIPYPSAQIGGWSGAARALQELWEARDQPVVPAPTPSPSSSSSVPASYAGPEQALSVICADSPSPRPRQYLRLAQLEPWRAGPIGQVSLWGDEPCSTWPAHSPASYRGPWNRPTAAPILVIGNTSDPSTPLANAVAMTQQLARARLLTVNGYGHTNSLNPSTCANNAEVAYLTQGSLPAPGTVCQQDRSPFSGSSAS